MKASFLTMGILCAAISSRAAETPQPRLVGIAEFGGKQVALMEVPPKQTWQKSDLLVLAPGQREAEIELLRVNPGAGTVAISLGGKETELQFPENEAQSEPFRISDNPNASDGDRAFIQMQQASASAVLKLYEVFSGRTLLRGSIREFGVDVRSDGAVSVSRVLEGLEHVLQAQGLVVRPEGSRIAIVGSKAELANVTAELWQTASQLVPIASNSTPTQDSHDDLLAPGTMSFKNADMDQVLAIFSELVDRSLLKPRPLNLTFNLKTVTPFSKTEATYLFLATLALHQIAVLPVGEKFVLIAPYREVDYFKGLLKQKMPSQELFKPNSTPSPQMSLNHVALNQFITAYTNFCQCAVALDKNLPAASLDFRSRNHLTSAETLYGMDLLLASGGMEIINDGHALILVKRKASNH